MNRTNRVALGHSLWRKPEDAPYLGEERERSIMSKYENKISADKLSSIEQPLEPVRDDPLDLTDQLDSLVIPHGVDRRTFLMRSAVVGAAVVITGSQLSCQDKTARATAPAPSAEPKGVAGRAR